MLILFALALTGIVLMVGLVIDGGTALVQRRSSQNASDFSALAGARVVAIFISGDLTNGTDGNVKAAIDQSVAANGDEPIDYTVNAPQYVDKNGAYVGLVGGGSIPSTTVGVTVRSSRTFTPAFLSLANINTLTASAEATARGGWAAGGPSGDVFPAGIAASFFQTYSLCSGPINTSNPSDPCYPKDLTSGNLNVAGGFGWLKFGAASPCDGFGLGMLIEGCDNDRPFLQSQIGPPPNSHGCCTAVSGDPAKDRIGSLDGNKVSADCSYYIDNKIVVTVPVWDYAGGVGANGWYHVIGFAGFQITGCNGGKDLDGVWRRAIFQGPTTATPPGFTGAPLAVQLIR